MLFSCAHGVMTGPQCELVQFTHCCNVSSYSHRGLELQVTWLNEYVLQGGTYAAMHMKRSGR